MMHEDQHGQAIEDVLHALRTSEPPQGYEARIHDALLRAQQEPRHVHLNALTDRQPVRSAMFASLLPYMTWLTAFAALLIVGIAARTHRHNEAPRNTSAIAHANTALPRPVIVAAKSMTPLKQQTKHAAPERERNVEIQTQRIEVAIQSHEYIPEPPMPLTQQERLAIRMMRRNTAQQFAGYTPDARARQLHDDAQAYHDYFAATSLDGQPIYVQPIEHPQISGAN